MAGIQKDGIEYEFTTALDLSIVGNLATASKDRTRLFRDPQVITVDTGTRLLAWLESGETATTVDESRKNILRDHAELGIDALRTAWEALDAESKHRLGGAAFLEELKKLAYGEQHDAAL